MPSEKPKRSKSPRAKAGSKKPSSARAPRAAKTPRPPEADKKVAAPRKKATADEARVKKFAVDAARLLADSHMDDVLLLDLRSKSDVTDYILIASGTSDRQIKSVGQNVEVLGQTMSINRFGRDADGPATWVVLDFVDVVVHLFDPAARSHYDLEMLWGDAPRVPWRRTSESQKVDAPDSE